MLTDKQIDDMHCEAVALLKCAAYGHYSLPDVEQRIALIDEVMAARATIAAVKPMAENLSKQIESLRESLATAHRQDLSNTEQLRTEYTRQMTERNCEVERLKVESEERRLSSERYRIIADEFIRDNRMLRERCEALEAQAARLREALLRISGGSGDAWEDENGEDIGPLIDAALADDAGLGVLTKMEKLRYDNERLRGALTEVSEYAELVGSQTDDVHIAVMKVARDALAK